MEVTYFVLRAKLPQEERKNGPIWCHWETNSGNPNQRRWNQGKSVKHGSTIGKIGNWGAEIGDISHSIEKFFDVINFDEYKFQKKFVSPFTTYQD